MKQSALNSFARFTIGFSVFIGVSLVATVLTLHYGNMQDQNKAMAAARNAMLK